MNEQVKLPSGLNILLSIWLIAAPFLLGYAGVSAVAMWNAIIVGVIVLILAGIRLGNPASAPGLSWVNALLGIWLIISPFLLGTSNVAAVMWNDILVGIGFAVFGTWSALATQAAMNP